MESKPLKEEFLTRNQVAELCHVKPITILRWEKKGLIKGYGIASKYLYSKDEILDLIYNR